MATLLTEVNNVLALLNEQSVETVTDNSVSLKVKLALEQAVREVATLNNQWSWLQSLITANSWSNNKATLDSSVTEVKFIRFDATCIQWVAPEHFFSLTSVAGEPTQYTRIGDDYYFYPYPDTVSNQDKVKFHVVKYPQFPESDSETFAVPDEFLPLFRYTAMAELGITHLSEGAISNYYKTRQNDLFRVLSTKRLSVEPGSQSVILEY